MKGKSSDGNKVVKPDVDHSESFNFDELLKNFSIDDYIPSFEAPQSSARPGDIIFTRSSGKDSRMSCVIQATINPRCSDFFLM